MIPLDTVPDRIQIKGSQSSVTSQLLFVVGYQQLIIHEEYIRFDRAKTFVIGHPKRDPLFVIVMGVDVADRVRIRLSIHVDNKKETE
jgi:hypothetical protein